jgi:hypothetical protein
VKPCCRDGTNPAVKARFKLGGKSKGPHFHDEAGAETRASRESADPTMFD